MIHTTIQHPLREWSRTFTIGHRGSGEGRRDDPEKQNTNNSRRISDAIKDTKGRNWAFYFVQLKKKQVEENGSRSTSRSGTGTFKVNTRAVEMIVEGCSHLSNQAQPGGRKKKNWGRVSIIELMRIPKRAGSKNAN